MGKGIKEEEESQERIHRRDSEDMYEGEGCSTRVFTVISRLWEGS